MEAPHTFLFTKKFIFFYMSYQLQIIIVYGHLLKNAQLAAERFSFYGFLQLVRIMYHSFFPLL
jgi:hypothetical protein